MYLYKKYIYVYASCSVKKIPVIDVGNCSSIMVQLCSTERYVEHLAQRIARLSCGSRRGQLLCLIVITPEMEVSSLIATCVPACDMYNSNKTYQVKGNHIPTELCSVGEKAIPLLY